MEFCCQSSKSFYSDAKWILLRKMTLKFKNYSTKLLCLQNNDVPLATLRNLFSHNRHFRLYELLMDESIFCVCQKLNDDVNRSEKLFWFWRLFDTLTKQWKMGKMRHIQMQFLMHDAVFFTLPSKWASAGGSKTTVLNFYQFLSRFYGVFDPKKSPLCFVLKQWALVMKKFTSQCQSGGKNDGKWTENMMGTKPHKSCWVQLLNFPQKYSFVQFQIRSSPEFQGRKPETCASNLWAKSTEACLKLGEKLVCGRE